MSKLVGTFVSRCYAIICNGAYCTRVQTCASVRFPNAWILWSYCVCRQHWRLASHIANLSKYRWVRRILAWNLSVRYRSLGRRPHTWDYQIQVFCRYKGLGPCLEEAKCHYHWTALFQVSYTFCYKTNVHNPVFFSPPVPKTGSPCGVQALTIGRYLSKLVDNVHVPSATHRLLRHRPSTWYTCPSHTIVIFLRVGLDMCGPCTVAHDGVALWKRTLLYTHFDVCTVCPEASDCVDTHVITVHAPFSTRTSMQTGNQGKTWFWWHIGTHHASVAHACKNFTKQHLLWELQHVERRVYVQSGPKKKNLQWEFQAEHARGLLGGAILNNTDNSTNTREDSMKM